MSPSAPIESLPDVSIVIPAFNEEACVEGTVRRLVNAFEKTGVRAELIVVDNGSTDGTGAIIRRLSAESRCVVHHRVERNQGYGHGVLSGLQLATAPWAGMLPADEQVAAEDVVRLYGAAIDRGAPVLAKVRRRFRQDSLQRKIVSVLYNLFVRLLWPTLRTLDVNGTPKLIPQNVLRAMGLKSKDWFLDPEIMIKAHALGLEVLEIDVLGRPRSAGVSHVSSGACREFALHLLQYRFGASWKDDLSCGELSAAALRPSEEGG